MEINMALNDMRIGMDVEGFYILREAAVRSTNAGKPFLSGTVSDRWGSIAVTMWDYTGNIGPQDAGSVIKLRGSVGEYKGVPQLVLSRLRPATEADSEAGSYSLSNLVPTAPIDIEDALRELEDCVASIEDEDYRRVAEAALAERQEVFRTLPAAKSVHHAFLGGLLMHTRNMLRSADYFSDLYHEVIDRSLLLTGTLLHDLAKKEEYTLSPLGLVTDYSPEGDLLGHPFMGAQIVERLAAEQGMPAEKKLLLEHMLLSHHGEPEFGAAVRPAIAESELLSLLDKVDSRMEIYAEAYAETEPGGFTPKIYALEKRLYRHR